MTPKQPNPDDREFRLSRYLDGDLSEAERRELENALSNDPALPRLLGDYRRTDAAIRSLRGSGPELDWERFAGQIRRRCASVDAQRRRRLTIYRLVAPLAAAAAIVLVCSAYLRMAGRVASPPSEPVLRMIVHVQVDRTAEPADHVPAEPVVRVRVERTVPRDFSAAPGGGKSYVIATAGADPFERASTAPDSSPFF